MHCGRSAAAAALGRFPRCECAGGSRQPAHEALHGNCLIHNACRQWGEHAPVQAKLQKVCSSQGIALTLPVAGFPRHSRCRRNGGSGNPPACVMLLCQPAAGTREPGLLGCIVSPVYRTHPPWIIRFRALLSSSSLSRTSHCCTLAGHCQSATVSNANRIPATYTKIPTCTKIHAGPREAAGDKIPCRAAGPFQPEQ